MEVSADAVADVVLRTFDRLEQKRKPLSRGGGVKEWVPLSGIVVQVKDSLRCVALATGMKCLPRNKISQAQGVVLHDWHAEILAIRSFNRFLLDECHTLALKENRSSEFVRFRSQHERTESHFQPFALKDGIDLHMYCSEAPCGDASMELTMAAQEDATPWISPSSVSPIESPSQLQLYGRSYFSALGLVRRKPSRPDAPPTLSKSCSDKLSSKQSTSLLSSITSLLISPANVYIHSLILPSSQLSPTAIKRAFSPDGRMLLIAGKDKIWTGGYMFKPFQVLSTERKFTFSRRQVLAPGEKIVPSNNSASWTPHYSETLIGGTIQGKKLFSLKGASRVCKRRSWKVALDVANVVGVPAVERALNVVTYREVKSGEMLAGRRKVKGDVRDVLGGWVRNEGGEEFGVEGVEA